jgi:acyl-CoA-binding protein
MAAVPPDTVPAEGFDGEWDAVTLSTIQYPLKFELAAKFMATHPTLATSMSIEDQLMFYGLHQQATVGPCNVPSPHLWNRIERTKWDIWKQLGNTSKIESMFLYTRSGVERTRASAPASAHTACVLACTHVDF